MNTKKVVCRAPETCKVRYHLSEESAPCLVGSYAPAGAKAVPINSIGVAPKMNRKPVEMGHGIRIDSISNDEWIAAVEKASTVHCFNVHSESLKTVVEGVTSGEKASDIVGDDSRKALAYEVLSLSEETRKAVVAASYPSDSLDDEFVSAMSDSLHQQLEDAQDKYTGGEYFPHTMKRVGGVLDAAYEAQRAHHAWDAMTSDMTERIYSEHPERIGGKWVVRGRTVVSEDEAGEPRNGDIAIHLGERIGSFDASLARKSMTDEQWATARKAVEKDSLNVSLPELKDAATAVGVKLEDYIDRGTTEVKITVSTKNEDGEEGKDEAVDTTTKRAGVADYEAGKNTFGSHFYVPDTSEMSKDKAFATLVIARERASERRAETNEIAQTLHASVREMDGVVRNRRITHEDSKRTFAFQANAKKSFNRKRLVEDYPALEEKIRETKFAAGSFEPNEKAIRSTLATSLGNEKKADEFIKGNARKAPAKTPRASVYRASEGGTLEKMEPSKWGAVKASERIGRGEAINGRVLTEHLNRQD